jgi:hypothetical protein
MKMRDAFPRSRLVRIVAHLRVLAHLHIPSRIFMFHRASLRFTAHLHVSSQFSAHHRRSIHPLSSQFLGVSHSIYYYI